MSKNIWGEEVLDKKNPADNSSVINNEVLKENALKSEGSEGSVDNLTGGYYYSIDGEYLGKEGESNNVFIAEAVMEDIYDENGKLIKQEISFQNKIQLLINHYDFTYCAGVILQEGKDYEELLFIAHTTNNEAKYNSKSLKTTLSSGYSSVPSNKKKPILDKLDKDAKTTTEKSQLVLDKYSRKAIIDVLNGGLDVSNGSQRWDGIDFIAWGMYHAPTIISKNNRHQKFNQYGTINISKDLYDTLVSNSGSSVSYASKKWENPKNSGSYVFDIPEEVFLDVNNWIGDEFSFSTNVNKLSLTATAVRDKTIYWKITK